MAKKKDYSNWGKDELLKEIDALRKQKTYGLVWDRDKTKEEFDYFINWEGVQNKEVFKEAIGKFPVLKEVKGKDITTDKAKGYNLLIEGDNYHSLAVLNFTHAKSVDVIYIDPPYNTGNKDFKYNDQWVDKEDGYRHSKWLSFMEKRIKLARELLKESGVIFISIDDNEFAQLKILCDEVFGEKNFVIDVIWNSRKSVSNDAIISLNHNHTFLYAKNISKLQKIKKEFRLKANGEKFSNPDNDPRGDWTADPFDAPNIRPNLTYPIKNPKTGEIYMPPKGRCWRTTKEEFQRFLKEGRIIFGKTGNSKPQLKRYLSECEDRGLVSKSIWDDVGTTTNGTQELEEIFGEKVFNNPKPISLIMKMLELSTKEDSIVLDFFAGSGTTGHAVLEYNKNYGGNRKFILCTNNEENICSGVCYPRIEKVIKGYNTPAKEKIEGLGGNLKYFKTDFVDSAPTDQNKKKIVDKSTEMICIKENAFEPIVEKTSYKIFKNTDHYLGIIFDEENIEEFVKEAKKLNAKINVYVFSLDDSVPEQEFKELKGKVKLCAIPEAILHIYRRVFKDD